MEKGSAYRPAFFSRRAVLALLAWIAACSILTGTLLAFLRSETPINVSQRTLTLAERVAYQRTIENVYWRHRIWPKERRDAKPSLDAVMSEAQLEKKVSDYLRKSKALDDHWQRPITADQLQAEMDRMAEHTKQPEVLGEVFEALGNDPFVIAECLARPALAERLLTNWYAYDQRIHHELKQRIQADLLAHPGLEQVKQLSDRYSEIEFVRSNSRETVGQAHRLPTGQLAGGAPALQRQDSMRSINLNSREWDETVQKLAAMFGNRRVAAGVLPSKAATITQIKTGVLSPLQQDETHYYATAVIEKTNDHLTLATVSWLKKPLQSWLATVENQVPTTDIAVPTDNYTIPTVLAAVAGCTDDTWIATAGPPDGREFHTAAWTGSEMIVWGGRSGIDLTNTGARYNPSTDSWATASLTNSPTARLGQTAVWTGSEMIIWGGIDESFNVLNSGGKYNPIADTWIATSIVNAPAARELHAAVWTGSEMIIWGGTGANYFNTGGRYDPNTDSWTTTSITNAPAARYSPTAVWTGSEMIVWGGTNDLTGFNTGGRYNPGTNSWTATSTINAPTGRSAHTAVWTGTEMIAWGGYDVDNNLHLNTGGKYTPGTNSWTATSTTGAPAGRSLHTAVWTGSQMIVWGGFDQVSISNAGGQYNPGTNSWTATSTTNGPTARAEHTAVWTGGEMIVWGGLDDSGDSNTGGRYDPSTNSWTNTSTQSAPSSRSAHTAVWTGSEMVVWGGIVDLFGDIANTGGRYNPSTDSWTATSTTNAPSERSAHTAVWSGSEMIVWGGSFYDNGYHYLNTGGRYNPGTDSWTATSITNAPSGRVYHTAIWTGSKMIVWGGTDEFNYFNTGGRYDPNIDSWSATSTTSAPSARESHTAVWAGSEMIVWGGFDETFNYSNTGGRYNPPANSWVATNISNAPSARVNHTAVWTSSEMIVWGGHGGSFVSLNTGGRYNPSLDSWTPTSTSNAPDAREFHTAVWSGSEMIVWGGAYQDSFGLVLFNTGGRYNLNTNNWTATSDIDAPRPRYSHTGIWTGTEMIVWGGFGGGELNTGGRYCAQSGPPPTPTPTPTASPSATATATTMPTGSPTATATATSTVTATPSGTPRVTPTARPVSTARSRPTPPPHLTPVPPPPSPRPTPAPRPTSPPHLTPPPTPSTPRPTPAPRP